MDVKAKSLGALSFFSKTALILLSLIFLISSATEAIAQTNKTRPACYSNSGDLTVPISMRLPYTASRTFRSISYVYHSSQGWGLNIPSILQKADQTLLYDGTDCITTVYFDPQKGLYFLSSGGWIAPLSGGGFAFLKGSGVRAEYNHPISLPNGDVRWLLTAISNRFGWRTVYRYDSSDRLYKIEVDGYYRVSRSQSAPYDRSYSLENPARFYVNLNYEGNTTYLSEVVFSADNGTVLSSYKIVRDPANKDLVTRIDIHGKNNAYSESYSFEYYTGGDFDGFMSSLITPLGGIISYSYDKKRIFWADTGAFAGYRTVLSVIQSDPDVPDQDIRIVDFSHKDGLLSQDFFYGFKEISSYRGGGLYGGETHKFNNTSLDTAGRVYEAFLFDSNGVPFAKKRLIYTTGGYNNLKYATKRVINISGVPDLSSPAKTANVIDFEWDASLDKLQKIHYRGLVGIDPITDQIDTSLYTEDDHHLVFSYLADSPLYDEYELTQEISFRDGNYVEFKRRGYRYTDDFLISSTYAKSFPSGEVKETVLTYDKYGNTIYKKGHAKTIKFEWEDNGYFLRSIIDDPDGKHFVTWIRKDPNTYLTTGFTGPDGNKIRYYFDDSYKLTEARLITKDGTQEQVTFKLSTSSTDPRLTYIESNGNIKSIYTDGFGTPVKESSVDPNYGLMSTALAYNSGGYLKRAVTMPFQNSTEVYQAGDAINNIGNTYGYNSYGQLSTVVPDVQSDGLGTTVISQGAKGLFGAPPFNPSGTTIMLPSGRKVQSGTFNNTLYRIRGDDLANEELVFSITTSKLSSTLADNNQANVVKLTYDSEGRVISNQINSNPPKTAEFEDNKEIVTFPSGKKMTSYYDSMGRLAKLMHEDPSTGESYTYEYFWDEPTEADLYVPKGALAAIKGPFDNISYGYDLFGRVVVVRHSVMDLSGSVDENGNPTYTTLEFKFEYDPIFQKVSKIIYPAVDGAEVEISYVYDSEGREKAIIADKFVNGLSNTTLRTVDSRDQKTGFITQATYSQGLIESYQYSAVSGILIEKKLINSAKPNQPLSIERVEYTNEHITKRELQILDSKGQYTKGTIEFKDFDSRNYPRKMVKTYQKGTNIVTDEETIVWDEQGRMVGEVLKNGVETIYKDGSNHPYDPDGVKYGSTVYPWTYDLDGRLIQRTGPEATQNITFEYGPDTKVRKVTAQNGNVVWFRQGVLGSIVERESYDASGNLLEAYREFLGGVVQQSYQGTEWQTTYNIFGESEYGVPDVIISVKYPALIQTFAGGTGSGPDVPPPPQPPPPPVDPNDPLCGNNKIDPGEQCDGSVAGCPPGTVQCTSKCVCDRKADIILAANTLGGVNADGLTFDLNESQMQVLIFALILFNPCRFEEIFLSLGIDLCDQDAFGRLVPNRNLLTDEDFLYIVWHIGTNRELLRKAAELIGFEVEEDIREYFIEEDDKKEPEPEEESAMDKVHKVLDAGGMVDLATIPAQLASGGSGPAAVVVIAACNAFATSCDLTNAVLYLLQGEWGDAGISGFSAIPILGSMFKIGKKAEKYAEAAKTTAEKAFNAAGKVAKKALRKVRVFLGYRFKGKIKIVIGTWPGYLDYARKNGAIAFYIDPSQLELLEAAGKSLEEFNAAFVELIGRLIKGGYGKAVLVAEEDLAKMRYTNDKGKLRGLLKELMDLRNRFGIKFKKRGNIFESRVDAFHRVRRTFNMDTRSTRRYFNDLLGPEGLARLEEAVGKDLTRLQFPDGTISSQLFEYLDGPDDMVNAVKEVAEGMGWVK